MVPRMSVIGFAASRAASAAAWMFSADGALPSRAAAAPATSSGIGATAARATLAELTVPLFNCTETPAPATAMSISFRGMNLM